MKNKIATKRWRSWGSSLAAKASTLVAALLLGVGLGSAVAIDLCVNPDFESGTGTDAPPWSKWGGTGGAMANPFVDANNPSPRIWSNFDSYANLAAQNNMADIWLIPGATYHYRMQVYVPGTYITNGYFPCATIALRDMAGADWAVLSSGTPQGKISQTDAWVTLEGDVVYPGTDIHQINYGYFLIRQRGIADINQRIEQGGYFDNLQISSDAYTGTVNGLVKDAAGPLAGASVQIKYKGTPFRTAPIAPFATLANGAYSFAGLIAGESFDVFVSKKGYVSQTVTFTAPATIPDIVLEPLTLVGRWEAEQADLVGCSIQTDAAASGGARVSANADNALGSVTYTVTAPAAGLYPVTIGYYQPWNESRNTYLTVNGVSQGTIACLRQDSYATVPTVISLTAGVNTIVLSNGGVEWGPHWDYIDIAAAVATHTISGTVSGIPAGQTATVKAVGYGLGQTVTTTTAANGSYSMVVAGDIYNVTATAWPLTANAQADASAGDVTLDLTLSGSAYTPLVDINASTLAVGSVSEWVNNGSLGGKFINPPAAWNWPGIAPNKAAVGGKLGVAFNGVSAMALVDDAGQGINAPGTIVGTYPGGNPVYTFAAWVYRADIGNGWDNGGLFTWSPFYYGVQFQYGGGGSWAADHWGAGNLGWSALPPAGSWHLLVYTSDGTTERVYSDGVVAGQAGAPTAFLNVDDYSTMNPQTGWNGAQNPFVLGAITDSDNWNFWTGRMFIGTIGAVRVYDQAFTQDDAAGLYNAWKLAEGSTYTISGTVYKHGTTEPVPNATVAYSLSSPVFGSKLGAVTAAADGTYTITDVLPGTYYVEAGKGLYTSDGSATVTVGPNQTGVNLYLTYRAPVTLVDARGSDLSGTVTAWPNHGTIGGQFQPWRGTTTAAVLGGYNCALFTGNNSLRLYQADGTTLQTMPAENVGNAKWTVSTWARQAVTGWQVYYTWAAHGDGLPANSLASCCWVDDGGQGAFRNGGSASIGWNGMPSANVWHNITLTYDGASICVYVDGVLNNSKAVVSPLAIPQLWPQIGSRYWNLDGSTSGDYFNGAVARVMMLDDALPADTLAAFLTDNAPPVVAQYNVSGHVYQSDGVTGIDGASVTVKQGATVIAGPITTSGGGAYSVTVGAGTYDIYASALNWRTGKRSTTVTAGNVTGQDIILQPIPADRLAISISASEATADGVANHGYYGGSFVPAQGNPAVALAGPAGDERAAINFAYNRWELDDAGTRVVTDAELGGNQPWTVVAWVYQDSTKVNQNQGQRNMYFTWAPLGAAGAAGCGLGWREWGGAYPGYDSGNVPTVCWQGYSDVFATALASGTMPWDAWKQVVTMYDGTALHFYINGVEVVGGSGSSVMPRTFNLQTTAGNRFSLGGFSNGWGDGQYWGSVARVKMYSKTLTQADINADLANPPGGFSVALTLPIPTFVDGKPTFDIPNTDAAKMYTLEYKDDLSATGWTPLGGTGSSLGNGTTLQLQDSSALPGARFYRLSVQ